MEESLKLALSSVLFETTDFFYLKRFAIAELSRKKKKKVMLKHMAQSYRHNKYKDEKN